MRNRSIKFFNLLRGESDIQKQFKKTLETVYRIKTAESAMIKTMHLY